MTHLAYVTKVIGEWPIPGLIWHYQSNQDHNNMSVQSDNHIHRADIFRSINC